MSLPHVCFIALNIYPVLARSADIRFVGGAEVQQTVQMRALQRAGYRISVLVHDLGQDEHCEVDGIHVHKIREAAGRGIRGTRFFYPGITDIIQRLREVGPDIVFVQAASVEVLAGALYARLFHRKFIYAGASDPDFRRGPLPYMSPQHAFLYRAGLRLAHGILVQNVAQRDMVTNHYHRDSYLLQNAYEETDAKIASFGNYVLWTGTVKPLKQPHLFIQLAKKLPHMQFCMVGGPGTAQDAQAYYEDVKAAASEVQNLRFVGYVPFEKVGQYFDGASLFVNTSEYEGLPNTFLQSWIRHIPTLSFVAPESSPGETGTIRCADLADLTRKVDQLHGDQTAWSKASEFCRQHFHRYHTMDAAIHRYGEIFQEVLSR